MMRVAGGGGLRRPIFESTDFPTLSRTQTDSSSRVVEFCDRHGLAVSFARTLDRFLIKSAADFEDFLGGVDEAIAGRVLADYGALYAAGGGVAAPPRCVFTCAEQVDEFQNRARWSAAEIAGTIVELQAAATEALLAAREEASMLGLEITPRGGAEAARRSFADTLRLWESRYLPAIAHWSECGLLTGDEATRLLAIELPQQQTLAVLSLEERGLYFSRDFSKSVFYSVAPPGASQHLSMLALDVAEFADARVRTLLARHGWFQTVVSDLPHFTYLGHQESELPRRGLRRVESGEQIFWIPATKTEELTYRGD